MVELVRPEFEALRSSNCDVLVLPFSCRLDGDRVGFGAEVHGRLVAVVAERGDDEQA